MRMESVEAQSAACCTTSPSCAEAGRAGGQGGGRQGRLVRGWCGREGGRPSSLAPRGPPPPTHPPPSPLTLSFMAAMPFLLIFPNWLSGTRLTCPLRVSSTTNRSSAPAPPPNSGTGTMAAMEVPLPSGSTAVIALPCAVREPSGTSYARRLKALPSAVKKRRWSWSFTDTTSSRLSSSFSRAPALPARGRGVGGCVCVWGGGREGEATPGGRCWLAAARQGRGGSSR